MHPPWDYYFHGPEFKNGKEPVVIGVGKNAIKIINKNKISKFYIGNNK
jgi:hypothetical protein